MRMRRFATCLTARHHDRRLRAVRDAGESDSRTGAEGNEESGTISNNVGVDGVGNGLLLAAGQIVHHIGTYVGENKLLEEMVLKGTIGLIWCRRGHFRSAFARVARAFRRSTRRPGWGQSSPKEKRRANLMGELYVMERGLKADFAFVKAWKGDREGNLIYRKTARNFNPMMATAAKMTIAEVEHLVEVGELDGDQIHTPSIYVKRIFQGELYERRIERRTVRKVASG